MQEEFETDNMSLFDIAENNQITLSRENRKIDVVRAEFIEAETLSWKELFEGYNNLFAITYSSGIRFICKLLNEFDNAEIIFGFDEVLSYNLQEIMAWKINKKSFVVDKKLGLLRYDTGNIHEANQILKELPEDLEPQKTRDWITMDLDRACDFFGINFKKKSLFGK